MPFFQEMPVNLRGTYMSMILYLVGFAFVIGGIAWALVIAKVSTVYIMIAVVILVGIAILTGVTRTRSRD
jgi:hypothetical protein